MALRIGLTGGVACGKSTVAGMLKVAGAHVLDADVIARELVVPGSPALQAIITHFGPTFLGEDGCLDRAALRARIFADPAAKIWLEALLHPLEREDREREQGQRQEPVLDRRFFTRKRLPPGIAEVGIGDRPRDHADDRGQNVVAERDVGEAESIVQKIEGQ